MSAYRLKDQGMFIPGLGKVPYIRHLQLLSNGPRFYFKVKGRNVVHMFGVYGEDYRSAFIAALEAVVDEHGAIYTCRKLRTKENVNKKNPTGYAGVYSLGSSYTPYRVTCPAETNEPAHSLRTAVLIREQASEERMRRNTFTVKQVLAQASL